MPKAPTQVVREAVWGGNAKRISQSARLKKPVVNAYRAAARTVLVGPPPKVLANSVPKSGTHLLSQLLGSVPRLWFAGMSVNHKQWRDDLVAPGDGAGEFHPERMAADLRRIRNGQFVTGHVAHLPGAADVLADLGFAPVFMVRDPRDLVVSLAFYLASREYLAGYHELQPLSESERLLAVIQGIPTTSRPHQSVPSIGERLDRYRGWLTDPRTRVIRFEDLVGPKGGGSVEAQHEAIRQVLEHCRRPATPDRVAELADKTFSSQSRTFRKGAIGDWQQHFGPEHHAAFDAAIGENLGAYGYA